MAGAQTLPLGTADQDEGRAQPFSFSSPMSSTRQPSRPAKELTHAASREQVVIGKAHTEAALNLCYLIFACSHKALTNEMDWQPSH
jgi:hypothetical protein